MDKLSLRAMTTEAWAPRAHVLQQEKTLQWEAHILHLEKACMQQWKHNTAKYK